MHELSRVVARNLKSVESILSTKAAYERNVAPVKRALEDSQAATRRKQEDIQRKVDSLTTVVLTNRAAVSRLVATLRERGLFGPTSLPPSAVDQLATLRASTQLAEQQRMLAEAHRQILQATSSQIERYQQMLRQMGAVFESVQERATQAQIVYVGARAALDDILAFERVKDDMRGVTDVIAKAGGVSTSPFVAAPFMKILGDVLPTADSTPTLSVILPESPENLVRWAEEVAGNPLRIETEDE